MGTGDIEDIILQEHPDILTIFWGLEVLFIFLELEVAVSFDQFLYRDLEYHIQLRVIDHLHLGLNLEVHFLPESGFSPALQSFLDRRVLVLLGHDLTFSRF